MLYGTPEPNEKSHLWYRKLRARWGNVYRARAACPRYELVRWAKEESVGEFAHSIGYEVFYFERQEDCTKFQLKWC